MHSVSSNAVAKELQVGFVCSTTLYSGDLAMTSGNTYYLFGAYSYALLGDNPPLPQGWHYEFVLSCFGTTQGNGWFNVYINNIATASLTTWSGYTFRIVRVSQRFRLDDIILEPTYQYSHANGCNLKIVTTSGDGGAVEMHCYSINLTAFAVKD